MPKNCLPKRSARQAPRPPGLVGRAVRRKRAAVCRAARPYLAGLATVAVPAVFLAVAAPGWLWLALLPAGAVLGLAADRFREHRGWHRCGGKAAARRRRRWQGHATWPELHRKHSLAAARRNAKAMRPSFGGRTRRLPPAEAGILIGTVRGAAK